MKKIMVLGAGIYQVPLIEKIKEKGHIAIVVTPDGYYPGIGIADVFIDLDTRNKEKILEKAKELEIDAILTTGTDVAVPTVGYINDEMNLNGVSYKAALNSTDKVLMKELLVRNNVNTADFGVINSYIELEKAATSIGYPIMVKAVDSSGSRGITKVLSSAFLEDAFKEALKVTKSKNVIVEKFLNGYEIGAQAIILDSEIIDIFLHSDEVTSGAVSVPIGHSMPLNIDSDLELRVKELITLAIRSLDINNTVSNVDLMIVNNEPYVIEIGARMGATCLPENISIYTGIDAYELMIDMALGENLNMPIGYANQANAAMILKSNKSGILKAINIPEETKSSKYLVEIKIDVEIGDKLKKFKVGPDRIGQVIVKHDSASEAVTHAKILCNSIKIEVTG